MASYFFVSFVKTIPSDLYKSLFLRHVEAYQLRGMITFWFIPASMFDFMGAYCMPTVCSVKAPFTGDYEWNLAISAQHRRIVQAIHHGFSIIVHSRWLVCKQRNNLQVNFPTLFVFGTDIHSTQMMNCNNFGNPLTFLITSRFEFIK